MMSFWDFADKHEWLVGGLVIWVSLMAAMTLSSIATAVGKAAAAVGRKP